jgi:integrase
MRILEGLRLRTKGIDFDRGAIIVREGKGNKDRVVMLPRTLRDELQQQLRLSHALWEADRAASVPGVEMPHALAVKYPRPRKPGAGTGCFRKPDCRSIRAAASGGATMRMRRLFDVR